MRATLVFLAIALTLSQSIALANSVENRRACFDIELMPAVILDVCTRVIQSKQVNSNDLAVALNNRGVAYYDRGRWQEALDDFNRAIELKPDYAKAITHRGAAYSRMGNDRAIEDHNEAIRLRENYAEAYTYREWLCENAPIGLESWRLLWRSG